ncbi:hypothetical protein Tco_0386963 [Tanacetum coccineum]
MPLTIKTQKDSLTFANALKQEMFEDLTYVQSLEKENDKIEIDKAEFSNMYDILLENCVSKDVMCSYLHSLSALNANAQTELRFMYHYKVKECECLAQNLSKQTGEVCKEVYNKLSRSFAKLEKHSISLELALQQCKEQLKNNTVCKETTSNVFRKECEQDHEIQDMKAQLQDKNIAIFELKKLLEKFKGKLVETKTDKPSFVRQPNAQRIIKPSVMGKPTPFWIHLKSVIFQNQDCSTHPLHCWIGCTKHMTDNLQLLCYLVDKYLGTLRFGNDQFAPIFGYEDLVQKNTIIERVYYAEGLHHNLFSVGQFCDADLEIAFKKSTCFVGDLQGNNLLLSTHESDLYKITL